MSKQVLKTLAGFAVTYHDERKTNKFVVTKHGRVVNAYADFYSAVSFVLCEVGNFEVMR